MQEPIHYITTKKVADLFLGQEQIDCFKDFIDRGIVEKPTKYKSGISHQLGYPPEKLDQIGQKIGFFKDLPRPLAMTIFTTKGGVLKSTLALNLARTAALHKIKTCVVGLDMQGDITMALGHNADLSANDEEVKNETQNSGDLNQVIENLDQTQGLNDYFQGRCRLNDIILPTDLPSLFLIPETPELVAMNDALNNLNRREFWIREKVILPLKKEFDLIIMDCSPNWNKLTTNALVACDVLISPLECKINNFRNFRVFQEFLKEFKNDMHLPLETVFVPTRYSSNRKLSLEIKQWYHDHVPGCSKEGIGESVASEEASAMNVSLLEHAPGKAPALEMQRLLKEILQRCQKRQAMAMAQTTQH